LTYTQNSLSQPLPHSLLILPDLKIAHQHLQGQKGKNNQKNQIPLFDTEAPEGVFVTIPGNGRFGKPS
jgi:hypothetical protein